MKFLHLHFLKVNTWSLRPVSSGTLPLRRRMDDEEEDMSQSISQLWGTTFRDVKYEDRASPIAAGQAFAAVTAAMPTSQSRNNNSISINVLPCSLHWQPRLPLHGEKGMRCSHHAEVIWDYRFRNWV